MDVITIPKKIIEGDDLVIIPRKEYEVLVRQKMVRDFIPTPAQKRSLQQAEVNLKKRKTFSYNEVARRMGFTD